MKSMIVVTSIFKKSWSLWRQAWLASNLLKQILKNNSGECSFQSIYHLRSNPNNDSTRRNLGQTWSRASTQSNIFVKAFVGRLSEEELHHGCIMEPVLVLSKNNYLCLIMPSKLLDFLFQPILVLLLSSCVNKTFSVKWPFLVNKIICFPVFMTCLHFCCGFMQITHWT
jgi:hypothetical protein